MSTRHATDPAERALERYMSAPQYRERRGLAGNLVAEKATLYDFAPHREMLFFLQSESLKRGGLRAFAARIIAELPHMLGSATMQARGVKPGTRYSEADMAKIENELGVYAYESIRNLETHFCLNDSEAMDAKERAALLASRAGWAHLPPNSAEFLLEACRYKASGEEARTVDAHGTSRTPEAALSLADLLEELCINPDLDLEAIEGGARIAGAGYIAKLWPILATLKKQTETKDCIPGVTTSIGAKLHETLDYALRTGRMVIVEGLAGSGKSTAAESWVRMHPGQARFVSLSGITHRTGLFQKIAAAIGLAACQRKSCELQAKIEAFFQNSGLMLVIDEAHHLWPKSQRVTMAPELVDWVNTALVNAGAPVALVCTDQFSRLKAQVEKATGWTSEQLMHRVKRFTKLPERPTAGDLRAVAELLLTGLWNEARREWMIGQVDADEKAVRAVVAYATVRNELQIAAVAGVVDEARDIAREAGRESVMLEDAIYAINERKVPSDLALAAAFAAPSAPSRRAGRQAAGASKAFVSVPGSARTIPTSPSVPPAPRRNVTPTVEATAG